MLAKNPVDTSRILRWSHLTDLDEIDRLIANPPIHSVVACISPVVADRILMRFNTRNRNIKSKNIARLTHAVTSDAFALTGDTIKFSKTGVLVDGQHRLKSCVEAKRTLTTHIVFGLQDKVFDVLDQGSKRTAADVLGMDGMVDATWIASAARWSMALEKHTTPHRLVTSNREIREMVSEGGRFDDLVEYLPLARQIYQTQRPRHSPSFLTAMIRSVGHKRAALAEELVNAWTKEKRTGRNETFDVLASRINVLTRQSGGKPDPYVRAAFTVQAINAWNAGLVVAPRALSWQPHQKFPALELDAKAYLRRREKTPDGLTDRQKAVLELLLAKKAHHRLVQMSLSDMAAQAGVSRGTVPQILAALEDRDLIALHKPPTKTDAAVYKVLAETAE
jgi:hypothetical protein